MTSFGRPTDGPVHTGSVINIKQILGKVKSGIIFYPASQVISDEAAGRVGYTRRDG